MADTEHEEPWITTGEGAQRLGLSRERVRTLAEEGKLLSCRTRRGHLVAAADVERMRAERSAHTAAHALQNQIKAFERQAKEVFSPEISATFRQHTNIIRQTLQEVPTMDAIAPLQPHIDAIQEKYRQSVAPIRAHVDAMQKAAHEPFDRFQADMTAAIDHTKSLIASATDPVTFPDPLAQYNNESAAFAERLRTITDPLRKATSKLDEVGMKQLATFAEQVKGQYQLVKDSLELAQKYQQQSGALKYVGESQGAGTLRLDNPTVGTLSYKPGVGEIDYSKGVTGLDPHDGNLQVGFAHPVIDKQYMPVRRSARRDEEIAELLAGQAELRERVDHLTELVQRLLDAQSEE